MAEEGLRQTDNKLIHIGYPIPFDTETFLDHLDELNEIAYRNDENIRSYVERIVPTYHPTYNSQKIIPDPVLIKEEKTRPTSGETEKETAMAT